MSEIAAQALPKVSRGTINQAMQLMLNTFGFRASFLAQRAVAGQPFRREFGDSVIQEDQAALQGPA